MSILESPSAWWHTELHGYRECTVADTWHVCDCRRLQSGSVLSSLLTSAVAQDFNAAQRIGMARQVTCYLDI